MMILAIEIQQPQYSGMTNDEIAGALNAVSATTWQAIGLAGTTLAAVEAAA